MSPNKKVTKEVGLGGGAECLTPEAKAVNYGILATGKYWYYRFAARSTTLPLRTLSRRAFYRVLSLFQFAFARLSYILYLISCILYLTDIDFWFYNLPHFAWVVFGGLFFAGKNVEWGRFFVHYRGNARTGSVCVDFLRNMD